MLMEQITRLIKQFHRPKDNFLSYMVEKLCSRACSGMPAEEVKGYVIAISDIKNTVGFYE